MTRDLLERGELLGNIDSFTDEQRKARQTFIEQELHLPRKWLSEDGCSGLDASVEGRVATGIYNVLLESDPRLGYICLASGFPRTGAPVSTPASRVCGDRDLQCSPRERSSFCGR